MVEWISIDWKAFKSGQQPTWHQFSGFLLESLGIGETEQSVLFSPKASTEAFVGYQTALCEFTRTNTGDEQQLYEMSLYRYSNSKYSAVCIDNLFHLPFRSLRSFKVEISQLKKEKLHFKALLTKCQQHHTLQYFLCRMTVFKPFIMSECFLIIIILNVL